MQLTKVAELGNFIRDQRRNARLSLRKLSGMAGISNPYLSQIERGLRRPSAEILQAIAKALRISAETLYVKAGILEERGDSTDPVTAILRDLSLSDKQKQAMVEIYQSFQHENRGADADTSPRAVALARAPRPTPTKAAPKPKAAPKRRAPKKAARRAAAKRPAKKPAKKKATARRAPAKRRTPARSATKRSTGRGATTRKKR